MPDSYARDYADGIRDGLADADLAPEDRPRPGQREPEGYRRGYNAAVDTSDTAKQRHRRD